MLKAILLFLFISLISSRTIQWTAAGGNPLWDFANNWDCLCIPTIADDVIINLPNIPGSVTISSPARALSLTVGGTSATSQSLLIQSSLTLGTGGGRILSNGQINLNAAPTDPFYSAGLFNASSNLVFNSGAVAGEFWFNNVNLAGAAAKVFNGSITVQGLIRADIPVGSQGVVNIVVGQLTVLPPGTFSASQSLTINSNTGARINILGTLLYSGTGSNTLSILGTAFITTLNATGGIIIFNNNATVGTTYVGAGATVSMIGALTVFRNFTDVSGLGTLNIQGGTNTFTAMSSISTVSLSGGVFTADTRECVIGTFTQTGGTVSGRATVSAGTSTFTNAVINNTPFTIGHLTLSGISSITGGTITVTGLAVVSTASQITFGSATVFHITTAARVTQAASLLLIPAGNLPVAPYLRNDGKWTSTADLTLNIVANGTGSFEFNGATISATGLPFQVATLILTGATFRSVGSTVDVTDVSGTNGNIITQSLTFTIRGLMTVHNFNHISGNSLVARASIGNLNVTSGSFQVTGDGASSLGVFRFFGGLLTSTGIGKVVNAVETHITGQDLKTISHITLSSEAIAIQCSGAQCNLLTLSAGITTPARLSKLIN